MKKDITGYRILNLTSGDNIIGQISDKSESSITLYRPFQMKIITMMDQAGPHNLFRQEALIMRNWLELSDDQKVTIPTSQIVAETVPTNKVVELYDEELEKEDNPDKMIELLNKLKEEEEDMNYSEDVEDIIGNDEMEFNIDPSDIPNDISDIIQKIIGDHFDKIQSSREERESPVEDEIDNTEDNIDTDKEMFGW